MNKNPYAKKYRASRTITYLKDETHGQLEQLKNEMRLKSINEVIDMMLEIQQDLRKQNLIKEIKSCEKCGAPIDVKLDSYTGITHQHVDAKSNCFGCITTKYRAKTKIEVLPGTIETKTEQTEQTEKEQKSETTYNAITTF